MAISVADNFSYKGAKPLDARIQYSTVANMKNATASDLYDGCLAYVTETKKNYQYDSSNTVDPTTGKWRELQAGGGGGSSTFADLDDVDFDDLQNGQVPKWNSTTEKWENGNAGGGSSYTAGDGIVIDNDEISVDEMSQADMSEIVTPLPSIPTRQMIYSTTEQVIGKWIDGKPIYQKTISKTSDIAKSNTINHGISNFGALVNIFGSLEVGNYHFPLTQGSVVAGDYISYITDISNTNFLVVIGNGRYSQGISGIYVTIQYTKSTDTAQ